MGTTSGIICLIIGIISIIASLFNPGSLILAAVALYAAYANLKGKDPPRPRPPPYNTDEKTIICINCGIENLAVAKVCRWCAKPITAQITSEN
jgi:hypothetical protein